MTPNGATDRTAALEAPPPGTGLLATIRATPSTAMLLAGTATCSCVSLTNVVGRTAPFHVTEAPETNADPETVRLRSGPPGRTTLGMNCVICGTGLPTARANEPDVPPPGAALKTAT